MVSKAKVAVLGASGYTGAELVRHAVAPSACGHRAAHRRAQRRQGDARRISAVLAVRLAETGGIEGSIGQAGLDVAFCALPHATTQKVIKELLAKAPATKVVDLSADFRLHDTAAYAKWYGHAHHAPELQKEAVYGLTEIHRREIRHARLVANPGCYTSCARVAADPADQGKGHRPR